MSEGILLSIESAALTKAITKSPEIEACAHNFVEHLLTPKVQKEVVLKNAAFSVVDTPTHPDFDAVKKRVLSAKRLDSSKVTTSDLKRYVKEWQEAVR